MMGEVAVYFEPAAVIVVLVLLGQVLELRARSRRRAPQSAICLGSRRRRLAVSTRTAPNGTFRWSTCGSATACASGPASACPWTASSLDGTTTIDESMVTGEPIPVEKARGRDGDRRHGQRDRRIRHGGASASAATRCSRRSSGMVSEAQRSRAPIQRLADTVSGWFVPIVIAVAVVTFVVWSQVGPEPRLAHALVNAVAVLIIACPCALGLATPMSIMVGTGRGAEAGVLIRNAEALEMLEKVTTIVVDKTGTLTEGKPKLVTVEPAARHRRRRRCCAGREPRTRQRASARRGHRRRRARTRHHAVGGARLPVGHRQRRDGHRRWPHGGHRQRAAPRVARRRVEAAARTGRGAAARGPDGHVRRRRWASRRAGRRRRSDQATTPKRSRRCTAKASGS